MREARQGDWVQIHSIILPVGFRAPQVPEETKNVPLEVRVRGFLLNTRATEGEQVRVKTAAGRELTGALVAVSPRYMFDYGDPQPELMPIGQELRAMLEVKADA